MRILALAQLILLLAVGNGRAADAYRQLVKAEPLPVALDDAFQFRKIKQYLLSDMVLPKQKGSLTKSSVRDPSIGFERSYRLHGAVTSLDQHRRYGDYLDFFWRALRPATITVRFEYRPEKLHSATQAREVTYPDAKGSHRTEFSVIGDDFFTDGRILAWRCVLIEKGRIVAETKSYLWR